MTERRLLVLVDGSNVARCAAWRAVAGTDDDSDLRQRLVDAVCSWAAGAGVHAQVVFDGAGPWRAGKVRVTADVDVIGSGRADGDDVVERRASNAHRDGRTYWIATSDHALQQVAGARADRVLDADAFVAEIGTVSLQAQAGTAATDAVPVSRLMDTIVDDETRARLERMRRGED